MADVTISLRSRKDGTGTALYGLVGHAGSTGSGLLVQSHARGLAGGVGTTTLGTLVYRGQVTISWNQNTEPDLAGYRVRHGTAPTVYDETRDVSFATTYQWGDLMPGMTHYFVVVAYDSEGFESGPSAQVSKGY